MVDRVGLAFKEEFLISLPYINIISYFFKKIKKDFLIKQDDFYDFDGALPTELIPTYRGHKTP